ncbi:MAG: hypothetical protein NVSMB9_28950 [Isosphaeraceae bacterium]
MRRLLGLSAFGALALGLLPAPLPRDVAQAQTTSTPVAGTATEGAPPGGRPTFAGVAGAAQPIPPVIGSHQIDRFDALQKLQETVQANPRSLDDWIILGEIAHEVAMDVPSDQAGRYLALSSDAFTRALALQPNNPGLKAAVQFSRDQQTHIDQFEKSRDAATGTFLEARRRDLAATGHIPYLRTFAAPVPPLPPIQGRAPASDPGVGNGTAPAAALDPTNPPSTTTAAASNFGTRQDFSTSESSGRTIYAGPTYQPFATPTGAPYTYQQYSRTQFPPGVYDNPAALPVTLQRYVPTAAPAVPNALERQILNRAARPRPR